MNVKPSYLLVTGEATDATFFPRVELVLVLGRYITLSLDKLDRRVAT